MNKRTFCSALFAALLVFAVSAVWVWCGGADFDRRTPSVSIWLFCTGAFASWAAWIAAIAASWTRN